MPPCPPAEMIVGGTAAVRACKELQMSSLRCSVGKSASLALVWAVESLVFHCSPSIVPFVLDTWRGVSLIHPLQALINLSPLCGGICLLSSLLDAGLPPHTPSHLFIATCLAAAGQWDQLQRMIRSKVSSLWHVLIQVHSQRLVTCGIHSCLSLATSCAFFCRFCR